MFDSFAGIQNRNTQPTIQLFLEVDLLIKGPCWWCLDWLWGHISPEKTVVCLSIPLIIIYSCTFLLSLQPFYVVINYHKIEFQFILESCSYDYSLCLFEI